jgi:hypothetical protein
LDCAHRYLLAAWTLSHRALFASHLAQVEEAQGNREQAIVHYQQALGARGSDEEIREIVSHLKGLAGARELGGRERKGFPLTRVTRRKGTFYVDLLYRGLTEEGKQQDFPEVGSGMNDVPVLTHAEKNAIAKALPAFPFPDAGPERIAVRVRVACLQDSNQDCSMTLYSPDETRREFYMPSKMQH